MNESDSMREYFEKLEKEVRQANTVAEQARKMGFDPEETVDITLTKNMAERVEGLISVVAPQLKGTHMTKRIEELEKQYGALAWEVALLIAQEVAEEKFCKFKSKIEAMEVGIRTGFAYHTVGIVAAPLEGFIELAIKRTKKGTEYFAMKFAGPIRGAGGTGASVSVIIADYVRKKMGYDKYDPSPDEISRFITELRDYHERVTNLQYNPSEEELRFLLENMAVEIDGEPTEDIDVSNYKDLPRIKTNRIRSGVCLVVSMLALKAPKLWKRLEKWGKDFDLEWDFLKEFLAIQKKAKSKSETQGSKEVKLMPNLTYISDLVAGRPVLTRPMGVGGFRLRYGRSRISGFSCASIHPSTAHILNSYIATGTQLKVERPGKAAAITFCDSLEGPIVKMDDGSVMILSREKEAKRLAPRVKEILFLGDILFNYGDFSENGHFLVPAGYNEDWYILELEKATVDLFGVLELAKISELVKIPEDHLFRLFNFSNTTKISGIAAFSISEKMNVPLHPAYSYHWITISNTEFFSLVHWLADMKIVKNSFIKKIIIPLKEEPKRVLELLGIPHLVASNEWVILDNNHSVGLLGSINVWSSDDAKNLYSRKNEFQGKNPLEIVNALSKVVIRDKSGTFIGARMGRPEKAKQRKMTGSPHVLFPVGSEGGRLRSFQETISVGKIKSNFPINFCQNCQKQTIYRVCESCQEKTSKRYYCQTCGIIDTPECKHGKSSTSSEQDIDIRHYMDVALKKSAMVISPDLIKGVKGTSNKDHISENLIKGILRAKNYINVNKDGTTRYDMSETPITHFKPKEIRTPFNKLKKLGYLLDYYGKPLQDDNQILELKPQDIILPGGSHIDESAEIVLFNVANFIDDLLEKLYNLPRFYNFKSKDDIIGCLVIGLAPHISAGLIGRVIGFSETQCCFAHPLWHAGLRRDCDGDEACVLLLLDGLINFSRQFLPDTRGAKTMDAPLVLTTKLVPSEVDDMAHGMDVASRYTLEFYEATLKLKYPWEVNIEQLKSRLGTPSQYEGMKFTHDVSDMNIGVNHSAYKSLPSMEEKLKGQMELAEKIRAVNASDVAALVIEKHFLKDIKGNLRKFTQQQFRCVKCNDKFRRPPLVGKCTSCGGKLIFTISEGSVIKYLEPSLSLAHKYNVPVYLKQTLDLTKKRIDETFGKEREKQEGLGRWFG